MEIERNDSVTIDGADWIQIYKDGETFEIFRSEELGDSDVTVEIHEYNDE